MKYEIDQSIRATIASLLLNATVEDITFVEEILSLHPDSADVKVGLRPRVRGTPLPDFTVTCVRGVDSKGIYWLHCARLRLHWTGCGAAGEGGGGICQTAGAW